jgi:hypothetical protein
VQVVQGIFVLSDLVGLDDVLKNAFSGEIELVGITPDGKTFLYVRDTFETFKMRIISQVFFVIPVGDDMALVGQLSVFEIRGIEAEELGFADLLGVAEKLVAVLQGFVPGLFELGSGRLALDNQQRLAEVVLDQNIGPTTAGTTPQFPLWLKFDVFRLVALSQQTVDALEHDKVFIRRKIAGLTFVDYQTVGLGIMDRLFGDIDA